MKRRAVAPVEPWQQWKNAVNVAWARGKGGIVAGFTPKPTASAATITDAADKLLAASRPPSQGPAETVPAVDAPGTGAQ